MIMSVRELKRSNTEIKLKKKKEKDGNVFEMWKIPREDIFAQLLM